MKSPACFAARVRHALTLASIVVLLADIGVVHAEKRSIHIDSGSAQKTLLLFIEQTGLQLLFGADAVQGKTTQAVNGQYEARDALTIMLAGTGLSFDFVNEKTIAVVPSGRKIDKTVSHTPDSGNRSSPMAAGKPDAGHLAQTDAAQPNASQALADDNRETLDEIVITGTHIRGSAPVGAELITIDREEIDRSGFTRVADVVRALPQNFGAGFSEDGALSNGIGNQDVANSSNGTAFNLRGLGPSATLTLVNGRRVAPGGNTGEFTDVANIPLKAVERIEVLLDGASAVYGTDAVGGVVNIILRKDYQGAESSARVGSVTQGNSREYELSQIFGSHWGSGHGLLSYSYYQREPLLLRDRNLTADSDYTRFGGSNFDSPSNNPGTIVDGSGQTWAIPANQNGTGLTAADFSGRQGTINYRNKNAVGSLLPQQKLHSISGTISQDLSSGITLSFDGLASHRKSHQETANSDLAITVDNSNPFYVNPSGATEPVTVNYNLTRDLGLLKTAADTKTYSTTGHLDIDTRHDWKISNSLGYSREATDASIGNLLDVLPFFDSSSAIYSTDPAIGFNPFGDGSFTSPDTIALIRDSSISRFVSTLGSGSIAAEGPLLQLSGGALRLATGVEYSHQTFRTSARTFNTQSGVDAFPPSLFDSSRNVTATYAEFLIPFFGEKNRRPWLNSLTLSLAERHQHYNDFGSASTPKASIRWSPTAALALRGTWSKSFRAPSLPSLNESGNFAGIIPASFGLFPSLPGDVVVWGGGNADLRPETATTWTAGADLTPSSIRNLNIGLTYYDTQYKNRIGNPATNVSFLTLPTDPVFADLVLNDPTAEQLARVCEHSQISGGTLDSCNGAQTIIDLRTQNSAIYDTKGLDFMGTYRLGNTGGSWFLSLNATYLFDFDTAILPTSPSVKLLNTVNNVVDFRLRSSVSWQRHQLNVTGYVNYLDSYRDTSNIPSTPLRSWTTLDLNFSYQAAASEVGFLSDTTLSLNIQNVFDRDPPYVNTGFGYDRDNADLLGRFMSVQLRKSW